MIIPKAHSSDYKLYNHERSDCCYRYYRSVGVIVRCLDLKQPDCMSLIVGASRSIFARDEPAPLKVSCDRQKRCGNLASSQWLHAECVLCVVCLPL